jgi:uncharacterized membrane protein YwzB
MLQNTFWVLLFLAIAGVAIIGVVAKKPFQKKSSGARTLLIVLSVVLLAYAVPGMFINSGVIQASDQVGSFFLSTAVTQEPSGGSSAPITCPSGTTLQNGVCVATTGGGANYQPTASYSARDKFSTTSISGTSYYKVNGNSATTTAYTNTNVGDAITYWVSNTTYWVQPITKTAQAGVTPYEALGFANSSATITLFDTVNRQSTTDGVYNTSMGANDQANIEITYTGTAKGSAGPFGGIMVVETNSTLASITCTGSDLMNDNPYHLTYTVTATTNSFKTWAYSSSLDDGTGTPKYISCQFKNGATAVGAGSAYYVKFIPANYYVSLNGDIVLDTEKYADSDTTRTGSVINLPSATAYWGA